MKVAILYICTGKYSLFWKDFYKTSEKYFLTNNHEKHYFVFTDSPYIYNEDKSPFIHKIHHPTQKWPNSTLLRFDTFLKAEKELKLFDFIYFFNANMLFVDYVGEEIFPDDNEKLVALNHPGYYNKSNIQFPYERNALSTAYIPHGEGYVYVMGSLNGGKADAYLELIKVLSEKVKKDMKNNIIAVWHDESHLNKYILNRMIKALLPSHGYPEDWNLFFKPYILIRDKSKWGGHNYLRTND